MPKRKKNYSKHDLRRRIDYVEGILGSIVRRIQQGEVIFADYVEMNDKSSKFDDYLTKKYETDEEE